MYCVTNFLKVPNKINNHLLIKLKTNEGEMKQADSICISQQFCRKSGVTEKDPKRLKKGVVEEEEKERNPFRTIFSLEKYKCFTRDETQSTSM